MQTLQIRMLGEFSLQMGNTVVSDSGTRSRKVWGLLAYLICHRGQVLSQKKLIDLLWGAEPASSNPENALRITLHRARGILEKLSATDGRDYILHRDGGYLWNPGVPMELDCVRFDALCQSSVSDEEERLSQALEALSLYGGEFLSRHSSEMWVIPIAAHFQNRFLMLTLEAARLLSDRGRHEEAEQLCRKAIAMEPYHEPLYQMLMQVLAAKGAPKAAAEVYHTLSQRLFDDFGIRPSEETRAIYRTAAHTPEDRSLPLDEVMGHLKEEAPIPGALVCDYDYFKVLCHAESRDMERSGSIAHIALIHISGTPDKPLSRRSLNRIMEQLGQQLRLNLRRGDTISQCSICQYIIMLPHANYENSCMVCRRILSAFHRAHPHVTAKLSYMVQPLTPTVCVP